MTFQFEIANYEDSPDEEEITASVSRINHHMHRDVVLIDAPPPEETFHSYCKKFCNSQELLKVINKYGVIV